MLAKAFLIQILVLFSSILCSNTAVVQRRSIVNNPNAIANNNLILEQIILKHLQMLIKTEDLIIDEGLLTVIFNHLRKTRPNNEKVYETVLELFNKNYDQIFYLMGDEAIFFSFEILENESLRLERLLVERVIDLLDKFTLNYRHVDYLIINNDRWVASLYDLAFEFNHNEIIYTKVQNLLESMNARAKLKEQEFLEAHGELTVEKTEESIKYKLIKLLGLEKAFLELQNKILLVREFRARAIEFFGLNAPEMEELAHLDTDIIRVLLDALIHLDYFKKRA